MSAEFLKAFPMLEDVLIESWQEGMGVGNPYSNLLPSRAYGRPHSVANPIIACANRRCAWVQAQRDYHRRTARMLTLSEKAALKPFFESRIPDTARVKRVSLIENPSFYADLDAMGIPPPFDFTQMEGITFVDTILVSDRHDASTETLVPLLFHELVHVVQYALLGRDTFVERYVLGWAENGQDYFRIPLESHAYDLQARHESNPLQGFSVEAEVRRQLELP